MKKYLKKSLSVFMAFLMVLSCFVFAPEMFTFEADAAQQGQYYYRFTVKLTDNWSNSQENSQVRIYYKTKNGKGTETESMITYNPPEGWWDKDEGNTYTVCEGTVPGFPYKVVQYGKTSWLRTMEYSEATLYVGSSLSNMTSVASGGTFRVGSSGNVTKTVLTVASGNYPKVNSISWDVKPTDAAVNVRVPGGENNDASKTSATFTKGSTVLDQYGVAWYQPANYAIYDNYSRSGSALNINGLSVATTGKENTAPTADTGKVTVSNTEALKNFVAAATTESGETATSRTVYAFATLGGKYSDNYQQITIENPTYKWTFDANGGTYANGSVTEFTQYYGTTLDQQYLPTNVTKTGYTYNSYSGYTAATKFTGNKTWYVQWDAIVNKVAFYDYNGQPLYQITARYDNRLSDVMNVENVQNPTRPAGAAGSYKFDRWVNWETGEELDPNMILQNTDSTKVLKFIAEYKIDDGQPLKTYNYNFYSGNANVSKGSGIYRSEVTFPNNPTKATETKDDGRSFEFAGWIVEKATDSSVPADVIVDTTKGEKLEDVIDGKTFLSVDDGSFKYYLKDNVRFYPVFVASYKQNTVTLHYKDAKGNWQVSSYKGVETTCLKWYNLGIPTPKSYNQVVGNDIKSYTFTGWTIGANPTPGEVTPPSDLELGNKDKIEVQLHNDYEVWATYEESDVQFKAYYYKDGVLIDEQSPKYNTEFDVTTTKDTSKERVDMTGYTFKGWSLVPESYDEAGNKVEQSLVSKYTITDDNLANPVFYAVYEPFDYYEVTFFDEEGDVLSTSKDYVAGSVLTQPTVADKEASAKYAYVFIGWQDSNKQFYSKNEPITVSKNETYTPVYEEQIRKYLLTFYDINGQVFDETGKETSTPLAKVELEYGTNIQNWIDANGLAALVTGAESFPKDTKQYTYSFTGWSPQINSESEVRGTMVYRATYKTTAVTYNVHWLVPTDSSYTSFNKTTSKYLYERIISVPSQRPTCEDPEDYDKYPQATYTWGFLGWYACDDNGAIKTDAEGNEIKFAKGTPATEDDTYYVAKFGYAAKEFEIKIYDEDKTTLLDTIQGGAYGEKVTIGVLGYTKASTADKHFVVASLNNKANDSVAATATDGAVEYTVNTVNELYVNFKAEDHTFGDWTTVKPQNYETKGEKQRVCSACNYIATQELEILTDDQAPTGIVYIGGYTWDGESDTSKTAYVKPGSLVNIIVRDLGSKAYHDDATAGVGIQKIEYVFLTGEEAGYGYEAVNVDKKFTIDKNVNIELPTDFEGKYLEVIITDYNGKTYKITTSELQVDAEKPVVEAFGTCTALFFGIKENYEINEVVIEKLNAETNKFETLDSGEYTPANIADSDYKAGYQIINPNGTYRVSASDMAGNTSAYVTATAAGTHTFGDCITSVEPTCTEVGYKHMECSVCGETTEDVEIDALGHTWATDYTTDLAATCTEKGSKSIHCSVCDAKDEATVTEIAALGHDENVTDVPPTCTKGGYKLTTCSRCDLWVLVTEGYDATGHTADATKHEHKDANCEEAGYDYDVCLVCETKFNEKVIEKLQHKFSKNVTPENACTGADANGHFYSVWECEDCGTKETNYPELAEHDYSVKSTEPVTEASCEQNAVYRYTCSRCSAYVDKEERFTALTHDYEWIVDTEAKCESVGSKHQECKNCGDKKEPVEIKATGHNLVKDEANYKDATCGTAGVDAKKCNNTGCTYTETPEIPATGKHNYTKPLTDTEHFKKATCTEDGYQDYQCDGCDATDRKTLPALGHKHAEDDEGTVTKVADCKNEGEITYTCINCNNPYTVITDIDKSNHDIDGATVVKVVTAATCTKGGSEIRNCKRCGSTVEVTTDALGHDWTKWVVVTPATCVENGVEKLVCLRCGIDCNDAEITEKTRPISATGTHKTTKHDPVAATCTKGGTGLYYDCSVCGKYFSDEAGANEIEAIPTTDPNGHDFGDDIIVPATCSADGYKYKVCSVCGDKTDKVSTGEAKLNHSTDNGAVHTLVKVNKAATCSAEGEGVYKCSLCGNTFTKAIAVDENAHSAVWSTIAATCTADGKRVKTCDLCGETLGETTIDALGHAYKITTKTELQNGKIVTITTHTCTRKGCGYSYADDPVVKGDACIVTFVVNGVQSEITIEKGAKLKKSDLPSVDLTSTDPSLKKTVKWMVDSKEVTFPMTVEGDITVYAVISESPVKFTVEFVHTLSKDVISSKEYGYDAEVEVPDDLSVAGYTFSGWSVSPSDTSVPVYSKETVPNATADVTYYAVFTAVAGAKTYYVTFKNTAGTKVYSSQIITSGATVEAAENPTKESNSVFHYVFAGWTDKDGNAVTFPMTNVTTNVTVYAKFNEVKHSDHKAATGTKAATCTDPAEAQYKCSVCGYEWTQITAEPLGHDYVEISRTEGDGKLSVTYKCSRCDSTWTKTVVYNINANIIVINVKDSSGNPVEGASVQLYLGDLQTVTAVTDANGQAKFPKYDAESAPNGLKDGKYTVKVTKDGYNTASGELTIKDGTGSINLTFSKIDCHCICHSSNVFGKIRRFFNKLIRSIFNKNYTCCDCGECEVIY